jgi:cyclohexanone monooxygenase
VDIRSNPISELTADGVKLSDGSVHPLDIFICATGFDAGSGGLRNIDIRGREGLKLGEYWADGARTHLGMMSCGFPNMFFINAIQSPSAFFLPSLLGDFQAKIIVQLLAELSVRDALTVEPTHVAEDAWISRVNDAINATLIPKTNSWWMGTNIPGKPRQPVVFAGGFPAYRQLVEQALGEGLQDYEVGGDPVSARADAGDRS